VSYVSCVILLETIKEIKMVKSSEAKPKKQTKTLKKPKTKDQKKNVPEISYWFVISKKKPIMLEYEFCKEISKGDVYTVHKVKEKVSGHKYAVKSFKKTKERKLPAQDINNLLTVNHHNIIRLKDIYESEKMVYLVLEYANGGKLFESLVEQSNYNETKAASLVRQLLRSTLYLHSKGVIHKNLKPENLLFSDKTENQQLKVANFALSRVNWGTVMESICKMPGYAAPELLMGTSFCEKVDMWSVGVITYTLLCGSEPFYDESGNEAMFRKILRAEYDFNLPHWQDISLNAKDLIRRMLCLDASKRISAEEALDHPWVTGKCHGFVNLTTTLQNMRELVEIKKEKTQLKLSVTNENEAESKNSPAQNVHVATMDSQNMLVDAYDTNEFLDMGPEIDSDEEPDHTYTGFVPYKLVDGQPNTPRNFIGEAKMLPDYPKLENQADLCRPTDEVDEAEKNCDDV